MLLAPISAKATLTSDAPREYVWRAFESAPRWPEVLQDIQGAHIEPDGRLVAGAVMRSQAVPGTMAVDMAYQVLEAERPHRLVTESTAAQFRARVEYQFAEGARGGTQITLASTVRAERASMRLYIALQRKRHTELIEGSLNRRMRAMLDLAEKIWREETQGH